jgi:hypothetical protein
VTGFPDPRHHYFSGLRPDQVHGTNEFPIQPAGGSSERACLNLDGRPRRFQPLLVLHKIKLSAINLGN